MKISVKAIYTDSSSTEMEGRFSLIQLTHSYSVQNNSLATALSQRKSNMYIS